MHTKRDRLTELLIRTGSTLLILVSAAGIAAGESENDFRAAQALADQFVALSPTVRPEEAKQLAERAYELANQLRQQYGVVWIWPPVFNNVLVNSGIKKRGLCFHWAEDLLVKLDGLKLRSLELHWGEARAGTWHENNCVVVTARGQPFNQGIVLDCWRRGGRLFWRRVASDHDPWVENKNCAQFVRNRARTATDERR